MPAKSQIRRLETIRRIRKPVPSPSRPHSSKKGKKGYNRRREKELAWEEVIEYLETRARNSID